MRSQVRVFTEVKPNVKESVFDKPFYVPVIDGSLTAGDELTFDDLTALMAESGYLSDAYVVETEVYLRGDGYYEEDGEWHLADGEGEFEKLELSELTADAVYDDLGERVGVPFVAFEVIDEWLSDTDKFDDWLALGSSPYVPCANSDDFEGIVEYYLERRLRIVPVV